MVEVSTYVVRAERGKSRWILQPVDVPSALSEVARLDQAEEASREAIAFVTGEPEDQIEVEVTIALPHEIGARLDEAERLRTQAQEANSASARVIREAARDLSDAGWSVRDIGYRLGVSHQRAHQLVKG